MLARQAGERDRQGVPRVVGEHDQRPHEVVPAGEEREDRERREHRGQHRHDDRQEDAPLARAVDARGLQQVIGDAARELAHEEDAEDRRHQRHDRAGIGVDQAERLEHQEQRQHRDLARDHERAEQRLENPIAPAKPELCERIAGHHVETHRDHRCEQRDAEAVREIPTHADAAEELAVVVERDRGRHDRRRQAARRAGRHERDREHPQQRKQRDEGQARQQTVDDPHGPTRTHGDTPPTECGVRPCGGHEGAPSWPSVGPCRRHRSGPLRGPRRPFAVALMRAPPDRDRNAAAPSSPRRSPRTAGTRPRSRCRGSTTENLLRT